METIIWEEKPTNCPVCNAPLKQSIYREDGLFCNPDGKNPHGKTYSFVLNGKKIYTWYSFPI